MTVVLTGRDLTLDEVVRVARGHERVELAPAARAAMGEARALVERMIADGGTAYGLTTGVGVRKLHDIAARDHDRVILHQHLTGHGPAAPHDVVRATALKLAYTLAQATTASRPELVERYLDALNGDRLPDVRSRGSIGLSDLSAMADLAVGVLGDFELAQGETIGLINQSAFATGWGALALHDATVLLDALDVAGALDLEAFAANRSVLSPRVGDVRPYPGVKTTLARFNGLFEGADDAPRNLQDPASFRTVALLNGATRDSLDFALDQLSIELNSAQSNPLVDAERGVIYSVGNFEIQPLATALDLARLALAPALTSACERAVKLLQSSLTDLPVGLGARPALAESALSERGISIQALTSEARLLAHPVSFDIASATQAEGIEDRMTMAPLAARRLTEMVELGRHIVAIELQFAVQACDLRGHRLGTGTARAHAIVRSVVPFMNEGDDLADLEPLVELICSGTFSAL
jgi:histidine ammonia-lyase